MRRIAVLGASGHARETAWTIRAMAASGADVAFAGFIVRDAAEAAETDEVIGDEQWLRGNRGSFDALALGVGMPEARVRIAGQLLADFDESWWPPIIHPTAIYDERSCTFGPGSMLAAGVVATVNVTMQSFSLANFGATIGHESTIGRGSVVNPGANISGGVFIEAGALVGTGAQVLQYLRIGSGATVGAGAVVTHDVAAGATVVGCPARPR